MKTKKCKYCSKIIKTKFLSGLKNKKFCSPKCYGLYRTKKIIDKRSAMFKICKCCGKKIYRLNCTEDNVIGWSNRKFCNIICCANYKKGRYRSSNKLNGEKKKCVFCKKNIYKKDFHGISKKYWGIKKLCSNKCRKLWERNRDKNGIFHKDNFCKLCSKKVHYPRKFCNLKHYHLWLKDKSLLERYGKYKANIVLDKFRNKIITDDYRKKCRERMIGTKLSKDALNKLSIAKKKNPVRYWLNKKRSKEDIEKFRVSHLGKKQSLETRLKRSIALKGTRIGKDNPNWVNGLSREPYDSNFNDDLKHLVKVRDSYVCKRCGFKIYDGCCHHIHYNKKDSRLETLVYLCIRCNSLVNSNRNFWFAYFCLKNGIDCGVIV